MHYCTDEFITVLQVPYDLGDIAKQQQKPFLQGEYGGFSSGALPSERFILRIGP